MRFVQSKAWNHLDIFVDFLNFSTVDSTSIQILLDLFVCFTSKSLRLQSTIVLRLRPVMRAISETVRRCLFSVRS